MITSQRPNIVAKRQRKMQEINAIAFEIVLEKGLESLSMHELARRLGVTVGALYRYYASRQSLIAALEIDCLERFEKAFEGACIPEIADLGDHGGSEKVLWSIADVYRKASEERPADARLIKAILAAPDAILEGDERSTVVTKMFDVLKIPSRHIEILQEQGFLSPGNSFSRALVLWTTVHGILQLRKMEGVSNGLIDVDELLHLSVQTLSKGWSTQLVTHPE